MKKANKNNFHLIILLTVCGLFLGLMLMIVNKDQATRIVHNALEPNTVSDSNNSKSFTSTINQFSLNLGDLDYQKINQDYNDVSIIMNKGEIRIIRNGTSYMNLKEYLTTFDSRRSIEVLDTISETINGNEAISRVEFFPNQNKEEKAYYIYVDFSTYILSTDSEALYDDLDQIARSFRYIP